MVLKFNKLTSSLAAALLVIFSYQVIVYKHQAFEFSVLKLKEKFDLADYHDLKKMGYISQSAGQYAQSIPIFQRLHRMNPADADVLSNLALALTFNNQPNEAFPFFRAYFSAGGRALDVMYWYGKTLQSLGQSQEAADWFYNILAYNPDDLVSAKALVATLADLGKFTEALSFMGQLLYNNRNDASNDLWLTEIHKIESKMSQVSRIPASVSSEAKLGFRLDADTAQLPLLNGGHYLLPFQNASGDYRFLKSDQRVSHFYLSRSDLDDLGWVAKKVNESDWLISSAHLGMMPLSNFHVRLCQSCESVVGKEFLRVLSASENRRGKLQYLVLHKPIEEK